MTDTFPRQYARTQRLSLGEPRDLTVTPDGSSVVFARSRGGADPVNCLWTADVSSGRQVLVADPVVLLASIAADDADLPVAERARRERMREGAGGITSYALSSDASLASFALGGQLFIADLNAGSARPVAVDGPVFDPRPAPTASADGGLVAYVSGRALYITDLEGRARQLAAEPNDPDTVTWGSADFIAAEEMGRHRGFWWSPAGSMLAVCRSDSSPVQVWHISDPADPAAPPSAVRYPAAGTPNADVSLHLVPTDGGDTVEVGWDRAALRISPRCSGTTMD